MTRRAPFAFSHGENYGIAAVKPAASDSPPDCRIGSFESPSAKTPIPGCVYGMSVECFCIDAFVEDMSRERGKPIVAAIFGELIIYHSEDNSIREYTTLKDWCNGMLKS